MYIASENNKCFPFLFIFLAKIYKIQHWIEMLIMATLILFWIHNRETILISPWKNMSEFGLYPTPFLLCAACSIFKNLRIGIKFYDT